MEFRIVRIANQRLDRRPRVVLQVAEGFAECLSNLDLGPGSHGTPRKQANEIAGVVVDMVRPRSELVLENAVLRHQVNVMQRRSKGPKLYFVDRLKLLLGAKWLPSWHRAIVLVQPETVLRWHRAGFAS
jgi:hypothetical protein